MADTCTKGGGDVPKLSSAAGSGEGATAASEGPTVKALCELSRHLLAAEEAHRGAPTPANGTRLAQAREALKRAVLWAEEPQP
jgi:hypothetical protein